MRLLRISNRIRQAFPRHFVENGKYKFFKNKSLGGIPSYCIVDKENGKYDFYKFLTQKKLLNKLEKQSDETLIRLWADAKNISDSESKYEIGGDPSMRITLETTSQLKMLMVLSNPISLLQKDPFIRLATREKATYNKAQLYKRLVTKEKLGHSAFEQFFGEIEENLEGLKMFQFHKWRVIINDNAKVTREDIENLLSKVEQRLGKFRNTLAYGKIVVTHSPNVLASGTCAVA